MINELLLFPILISFVTVLSMLPHWIRRTYIIGLMGKDMHKMQDKPVAEAGGIVVIAGFVLGVLGYIALKTFYFHNQDNVVEIFALLSTVIIIAFIGMIDDIFGWKIGLSKKTRLFWILIAAIPLVVINAGSDMVSIPFIGEISLGLLFPLLVIPIGIVGASTSFNFVAGYNGLEAGMGIILITTMSIVSGFTGATWLSLVGLCMVSALFGFLLFNWYPAKVFPGDVLTYSIGGLIASMAILGNFERFAIFIFIPYIAEIILKLRGKLKKESFSKPGKFGDIEPRYEKWYGIEHIALSFLKRIKPSKKVYEYEVVLIILGAEIILILLGFLLFNKTIFI